MRRLVKRLIPFVILLAVITSVPASQAATGDLAVFQTAAVLHAQRLKVLISDAKQLRAYWDKVGLPGAESATAPLATADLTNYATLLSTLQDMMDNVAVSAGDRRGVMERVATKGVVNGY